MLLRKAAIGVISAVAFTVCFSSTGFGGWWWFSSSQGDDGRCCCLLSEPPRGDVVSSVPVRLETRRSEADGSSTRLDDLENDLNEIAELVEKLAVAVQQLEESKAPR